MKKSIWGLIASLLFGILFNACNSTRVVSSWRAPEASYKNKIYRKVLVIGLMGAKYREIRENIENDMVASLQAHGINAGSAYAEYGPITFRDMDEKTFLQKIGNKGYDGTLTIALLDKSKQRRYNPGSYAYMPYTYYNRFWGYYNTVYSRLYDPGYYTITTNYLLEANFYNLNTERLIYSAQTKSFDPANAQTLAKDLSKTLVDDMMKKGVIIKTNNSGQ